MPRRGSATPTLPAADFLVIGSGVAGLRAAIGLSRAGRVLVLTKGTPEEGSSIYAQGGVAVGSGGDGIARRRADTLRAGERVWRLEAVQGRVAGRPRRGRGLIPGGAGVARAGG